MQETKENLANSLEANLSRLNQLLERERTALLDGDAKTVAEIAKEKEHIGMALADRKASLSGDEKLSSQITDLSHRTLELAQLNHMLLGQMYQHYNGMLELFMRLSGNSTTYGSDGMMAIQNMPLNGAKIMA